MQCVCKLAGIDRIDLTMTESGVEKTHDHDPELLTRLKRTFFYNNYYDFEKRLVLVIQRIRGSTMVGYTQTCVRVI